MADKKIQNKIQEYRQQRGLTQDALAQEIGVTRQTIISIEKGSYTPSLMLAFSFAFVFNKKIEELFWLK